MSNEYNNCTKLTPCGEEPGTNLLDRRNGVTFYGIDLSYDDCYLLCPVCGGECSHVSGAYRNDARHDWAKYGNAAVQIRGECGHNWLIVFNDHKGNVSAETVVLPDDPKMNIRVTACSSDTEGVLTY